MSDESDDWMDDESHASLKAALQDAYAESKRLRDALQMVTDGVDNANRWAVTTAWDEGKMELHDVGDYLDRHDVKRLVAEAMRQSTGNSR